MPHTQFPCAQCGANVEFKPGADALVCPYCGHNNPIEAADESIEELDFHAHLAKAAESEETEEVSAARCESCGAECTLAENVTSDECPFCGSAIVTKEGSRKVIKPRALLPFKVTRKESTTAFTKWLQGLWFAPSKLKKRGHGHDTMQGVYVPYWTYDCRCHSRYTGERGEHYYVNESYTAHENGKSVRKTRRVRKTRWHHASGNVQNAFDDVLVLASQSLPRKYAEKLEPWDLDALTPYQDDYLTGFKTESYQVDLDEGFGMAKEQMEPAIRSTIRSDIGGDEQRIHSVNTTYSGISFKHILLPVWISAYRYQENVFRFLVNARTGEVQGERPWSWAKIVLAVLGGIATIAAIAGAVQFFR
jgi:DNA-directed RNA polymerase subunit RPC12/RpoP